MERVTGLGGSYHWVQVTNRLIPARNVTPLVLLNTVVAMFSTKKLVDECAGTLAQMAEVLHKHVAQQHEFQQYQYSVNEHVFEAQKALTGYVNSLADELVGLREEVNIIRVEYARLIQLVKEYRNGEEAG